MPKIFTKRDYLRYGEEKGLTHTDPLTPRSVRQATNWQCVYCGKQSVKTLRAVQLADAGCICQTENTLGHDKYHTLAQSLGIKWVATLGSYPTNNKTQTMWEGTNGDKVPASYHQLYRANRISKQLRVSLGI